MKETPDEAHRALMKAKFAELMGNANERRRRAIFNDFVVGVPSLTDEEQVELYNALVTAMAAR